MNIWSRFPFLRISLFFAIGVLLAEHVPAMPYHFPLFAAGLFSLLAFGTAFLPSRISPVGYFLLAGLVAFGYLRYASSDIRQDLKQAENVQQGDSYLLVTAEKEVPKGRYYRCEADLLKAGKDGHWHRVEEKVLLYRQPSGDSVLLPAGQVIMAGGEPDLVPSSPHAAFFDYAAYLRHKQMRFRFFLKPQQYVITDSLLQTSRYSLARLRAEMVQRLTSGIRQEEVRGVLGALVLGHRSELDRDTRDAYAAAGAMHVLAVSGLHVGILYGVLLFVYSFMLRWRFGRYIRLALILLLLGSYAVLTGLSPSVTRAVIMFALLAIGQATRRRAYIYNSLAVAAFISLLIDPHWLFAPGFQLSYLAVAGIVYLHPRIHRLWEPPSVLLEKIWSLSAVTLAAQVATLPLTWYYFGQFPVYFLGSNLLVIPLATISLIAGLLRLVFADIPLVGDILTLICEYITGWLNSTATIFEALPLSRYQMPYLSAWEVILLFILFFSLTALLRKRRFSHMWQVSLVFLLLVGSMSLRVYRQSERNAQVWYPAKGGPYVEAIRGYDSYPLAGIPDESLTGFQIVPLHRYFGISGGPDVPADTGSYAQAWLWQNEEYLLLRGDYRRQSVAATDTVDVLAVDRIYGGKLEPLLNRFLCKELILTGYVSERQRGKLITEAEERGLIVHFLRDEGLLIR